VEGKGMVGKGTLGFTLWERYLGWHGANRAVVQDTFMKSYNKPYKEVQNFYLVS